MISELKDDEILELLMSSDFIDDYKPEELKYLLFKWRYFYRILHGKYELEKVEHIGSIEKKDKELNNIELYKNTLLIELKDLKERLDSIKNRKLTFIERISGKIKM